MVLLLRTGLRIGEVAELDASDVRLTQRTGELVVRHGKGTRATCRWRPPPLRPVFCTNDPLTAVWRMKQLFELALQREPPWRVVSSDVDFERRGVDLRLGLPGRFALPMPAMPPCLPGSPVHRT